MIHRSLKIQLQINQNRYKELDKYWYIEADTAMIYRKRIIAIS